MNEMSDKDQQDGANDDESGLEVISPVGNAGNVSEDGEGYKCPACKTGTMTKDRRGDTGNVRCKTCGCICHYLLAMKCGEEKANLLRLGHVTDLLKIVEKGEEAKKILRDNIGLELIEKSEHSEIRRIIELLKTMDERVREQTLREIEEILDKQYGTPPKKNLKRCSFKQDIYKHLN